MLVGKNESGKSAVLRTLSKMDPSDGAEYDGLREFPCRRYTDEFAKDNWPVASVRLQHQREQSVRRAVQPRVQRDVLTHRDRRAPGTVADPRRRGGPGSQWGS